LAQVRLLGPVDVVVGGAPRPVAGLRRKTVLAMLALHAGEVVSSSDLAGAVWGPATPPGAAVTLRSHISYLRTVLGAPAAILARPPGYVLDLAGDATDVRAAQRLLRQASQAADPGEGARCLREALGLWRGRPLAELAGLPGVQEQARRLDVLRVQAQRALIDTGLAAGEHAQLVPELEQMAAEHPLDEKICEQLMVALYRSGRRADALTVYQRLRHRLAEEMGIDPGQALDETHAAIVAQQAPLAAAPKAPVAAPPWAGQPVPAQLPPAVPGFAGRAAELASLDALLPPPDQSGLAGHTAVVVSAVSGTAGVGKTALAVHWARRVAAQFPDGQLYVNLRGFDPGGPPLRPGQAVRGFLGALGVPAARVPQDLQAQAALYRSLLAGKRVLVVLDNARDAGQARPLLPGTPGCLVIVTSRNQLTGLAATEGAYPLALDLLTTAEARDLLVSRLGASRVASDPRAADEIIQRCARLPLALALVAARAASSPDFPLAVFAAELREADRVLDAFDGGEWSIDMRAVFSWSYRALSTEAARLFRLLGLHPGPGISVPAAASMAGASPGQARALLTELARAQMLTEHKPGRYTCHDLLRAFAAELAHSLDTETGRRTVLHRMLDHYLHAAHAATIRLDPDVDTIALPPPVDPNWVPPAPAADYDAAWAWLATEQDVVLAAIDQAAAAGLNVHAWQLAWSMDTFLSRQGRWREQASVLRTAVAATRQLGDPAALGMMLRALTRACTELGRWDDAHASGEQALRLFTEIGDLNGQALTHLRLGAIHDRQGRPGEVIGHVHDALSLYRAAGNHTGQALALNNLGWVHACLGDHQQALTFCQQALPLLQQSGDQEGEAETWDSIGYAHHNLGSYRQAIAAYQAALKLIRATGGKSGEALILSHLGDTLHATASYDAARDALQQALAILSQLGHPDAGKIRAKLDSIRPQHQ
jgi:DNA-binding SARP family transcriptional activator/tetratricopeptide (TPR) repeat protein